MMQGVVERGTGTAVAAVGKPLAGKTGTTSDWFDAWFVGFSPDLAAGVFVGFDDPRTLGDGEVGGHVAAPIFRDFMAAAPKDAPAKPVPASTQPPPIPAPPPGARVPRRARLCGCAWLWLHRPRLCSGAASHVRVCRAAGRGLSGAGLGCPTDPRHRRALLTAAEQALPPYIFHHRLFPRAILAYQSYD